ncbi:hypothetical protein ACHAWO_014000 [Cyclotella atomus]|jgi:undecaprenyl diphosphate synthase|uniref:Alkyl transferase n=1 Tax=Cyclotella atomus TaxID=382360 RepID=A0ABD3QGJ4_9STRA
MAAQNWKSRAESVLSQFINSDDSLHVKSFITDDVAPSYLQDNSSTNALSCSYGVYDRLLGCDCIDGAVGHVGNGPCFSVVLAWIKLALGRVMRMYLSNPLLLALVPLFMGVGLGFWIGRRSVSSSRCYRANIQPKNHISLWKSTTDFVLVLFVNVSAHLFHVSRLFQSRQSNDSELFVEERDEVTRQELRSQESTRESGVDLKLVPRHIAVIMDGNRRYGKAKYGNATRGHWDGSKTLIEFTKWCMAEGVQALTVYAFSTENWDRDPAEVSALMSIFCKYCEELRVEALQRGIQIHVLETESERVPPDVREGIDRMVSQTKHCDKFTMNICLSYGARGEIVNACKKITKEVLNGSIDLDQIGEDHLQKMMLTGHCCDPDVVIRTSGEERLSNFLLWQSAYSELFFLKKQWPELKKEDLIGVIRGYAEGRERRYGK